MDYDRAHQARNRNENTWPRRRLLQAGGGAARYFRSGYGPDERGHNPWCGSPSPQLRCMSSILMLSGPEMKAISTSGRGDMGSVKKWTPLAFRLATVPAKSLV